MSLFTVMERIQSYQFVELARATVAMLNELLTQKNCRCGILITLRLRFHHSVKRLAHKERTFLSWNCRFGNHTIASYPEAQFQPLKGVGGHGLEDGAGVRTALEGRYKSLGRREVRGKAAPAFAGSALGGWPD